MNWTSNTRTEQLQRHATQVRRRSRHLWRRLALLAAVLGPGLITSNVDNDAGGISTYSLAGAQFGYTLLWSLIPMTIALYVTEEMCARMAVVTGKGLSDLIREEFGFRPTFFVMVAGFLVDLGNVVAEFAGVASAMEIFGISRYIAVPTGGAGGVDSGAARNLPAGGEDVSGAVLVLSGVCVFRLSGQPGLAGCGAAHGDSDDPVQYRLSADADRSGGHHDRSVAILLHAGELCGKARGRAAISAGSRRRDRRQRELHGDRLLHHRVHGGNALRFRPSQYHRRGRRGARTGAFGGKLGRACCSLSAC